MSDQRTDDEYEHSLLSGHRRGSADAMTAPVDEQSPPARRVPAASGHEAEAESNPMSEGRSGAGSGGAGARGGPAPSSGRSAPTAPPTSTPLSPDMTNLSPMHGPSRQLIHVPPMPLPDAAGGPAGQNLFDDVALSPTGREAAEVLSTLTGSKRTPDKLAELTAERDSDDDDDEEGRNKKLRGSRCGTCVNCLRPDCGQCTNCMDKPKFGGPGIKKQACTGRKCLAPNVRGGPPRQVSLFKPTPPGPQPMPGPII